MLTAVNLADNSELGITSKDLKFLKLSDLWLKVIDPTDEELKSLARKLDVSVNLIRPIEIPTFSAFHLTNNMAILYLSAIRGQFELNCISKVAVVLGKGFMITISVQSISAYDNVKNSLHKGNTEIAAFDNLVYGITSSYMSYLESIEEKLPHFESLLMANMSDGKKVEEVMTEVFDLKTRLSTLSRLMWYERSAISSLKRSELPFDEKAANIYIDGVVSELAKHIETVHTQIARLSDVVYEYETKATRMLNVRIEKLTEVMKKLTAITVILTIPLMISGHFGMNFKVMPELDNPLAYPLTLAVSVIAVVVAALVFRKKGWI
ncbi:magnesium transporter CorA family protein [archaeon]|nr:MAG: magnesium transporter CorA family protein [archaeon]